MGGPLPNPNRRRRNAPTIPTTSLPAAGRKGAPPKPPRSIALGDAATAWWRWAWHTPQAAAWSKGDLYVTARRAQLEDAMAESAPASILREARELDDRLGLSPKGMAALRWVIIDAEAAEAEAPPDSGTRRLRAVDSTAS